MVNVFSRERLLQEVDTCASYTGINPEEIAEKLAALAEFGRTAEGGMARFPYTDEEKQAKALFAHWMEEAGLTVREDEAGNLFGRLEGENPELPLVLTGSHLDTVPNGGAFDGILGCVSSLLAVKALKDSGVKLKRSIEVVVFVDEEGTRFKSGLFGSRVMLGEVKTEDLKHFYDDNGITQYDAMKESGFRPDEIASAKRNPKDIHAFLELHIEQGKRLEAEGKNIGVVNGIAGPSWGSITFYGETDHAGNTPMEYRRDTVAAAGEFILAVEKMPRKFSETAVATVGKIHVHPNGTNVISGKTEVVVDARDIDEDARDRMLEAIKQAARDIAESRGLTVDIEEGIKIPPVVVPDDIREIIQTSAGNNGLSTMFIPSGAGHDAMIVGKYVPAGMIFVPSHKGKSHSPEEWTSLPDCVNGIQVMKESLEKLANQ
ncbi:MAG TPA: Zn-dependent hydrolase [Bacillaceae bacterium]